MSDDDVDLEALFDEISDKTLTSGETADAAGNSSSETSSPKEEQSSPTGDTDNAASKNSENPLENLQDLSDKPMYERLGGIVRLLHDSMRELGYDRSLTDVASQMGDAKNRLSYVATLTEQAANKVLNAIDQSMPEQDKLHEDAKHLNDRWAKLYAGELSVDEFKTLANDAKNFTEEVSQVAETQKSRLLEMMMAQDFQDLTGQLIKKIVNITSIAEKELAQLLRDNAPAEVKAAIAEKPVELLNGPSAPGAALEQNDVDDLLDSLGF